MPFDSLVAFETREKHHQSFKTNFHVHIFCSDEEKKSREKTLEWIWIFHDPVDNTTAYLKR